MDEFIDGGGIGEIVADDVVAPVRPVVRLEDDLNIIAEQRLRLGDIAGPGVRVADLRAAEGIEVMERAGAVFRHPEGLALREVGVHLGGRFGAGGELEDGLDTVQRRLEQVVGDLIRGRQIADAALHDGQADADREAPLLALAQDGAVLVHRAPLHGGADEDVLRHNGVRKPGRTMTAVLPEASCSSSGSEASARSSRAIRPSMPP